MGNFRKLPQCSLWKDSRGHFWLSTWTCSGWKHRGCLSLVYPPLGLLLPSCGPQGAAMLNTCTSGEFYRALLERCGGKCRDNTESVIFLQKWNEALQSHWKEFFKSHVRLRGFYKHIHTQHPISSSWRPWEMSGLCPPPLSFVFYRWANQGLSSKQKAEWLALVPKVQSWDLTPGLPVTDSHLPPLPTTTSINAGNHPSSNIFSSLQGQTRTCCGLSRATLCAGTPVGKLSSPTTRPNRPSPTPHLSPAPTSILGTCFPHGHLPHSLETLHFPVFIAGLWAPWGQGLCLIHL